MKKSSSTIIAAFAVVFAMACNSNPENTGSSTPVDSTNLTGAPAATYGAQDPANPSAPKYEGGTDTGLKANTASHEDSMKGRQ